MYFRRPALSIIAAFLRKLTAISSRHRACLCRIGWSDDAKPSVYRNCRKEFISNAQTRGTHFWFTHFQYGPLDSLGTSERPACGQVYVIISFVELNVTSG
jgi:hypothetical protein